VRTPAKEKATLSPELAKRHHCTVCGRGRTLAFMRPIQVEGELKEVACSHYCAVKAIKRAGRAIDEMEGRQQ
jgi:hypothetical protein